MQYVASTVSETTPPPQNLANEWLIDVLANGRLTPKGGIVGQYIAANPRLASFASASDLAERTGVNVATVVRFAQNLGFGGWPEFQLNLRHNYLGSLMPSGVMRNHLDDDGSSPIARALRRDVQNLEAAVSAIDLEKVQEVARIIAGARRTLIVGAGSHAAPGLMLAHLGHFIGYDIQLETRGGVHVVAALSTFEPGDCVITMNFWRVLKHVMLDYPVLQARGNHDDRAYRLAVLAARTGLRSCADRSDRERLVLPVPDGRNVARPRPARRASPPRRGTGQREDRTAGAGVRRPGRALPMTTPLVLRDVNVLDESGGFSGPVDVSVADGRITAVERNPENVDGAVSVDCSGLWLMPGIFDCHDHLMFCSIDSAELLSTPITRWTLEATRNLRRTLECGVTFVRDAAGADAGVRDSVARGYVPGPHIQVSVVALSETGGHFDGFLTGPGIESASGYVLPDYPGRPPFLVDGVDEMRRGVRRILRAGADWIKLCATGGIVSPFDDGDLPQFTREELDVAVEEAERKGKGVMAHAFGGQGLDDAVAAGVRSIEHGLFLTEQQAATMAAAGTWLIPTLSILRDVMRWADEPGRMPDTHVRKVLSTKSRVGSAVRIAHENGVKLALGTDFIERGQHGRNLEELLLMHEAGLPASETLLAATIRGAELCGVDHLYGRIAPGYVFDAILLDEDPSDISVFGRPGSVTGVFKGGATVVEHPRFAGSGNGARRLVPTSQPIER